MIIDYTPLSNAILTLEEAIEALKKDPSNKFIQDACIQRFVYTYELCHKMVRRFLEHNEASKESVDSLSFPDLMRLGFERGLLKADWSIWRTFREVRNTTSHAYDETKAASALSIINPFLTEAQFLLMQLHTRTTKSE